MPHVADLAFMLRLGEDKITALLEEFVIRACSIPLRASR
jgi:hypothetical protein